MRVAWVLLVLCGCTAIFDLRSVPNGDRDADGASDDSDNCVDIYNPDQSNYDGDESGDACDQCIATAPDDDEDGIPDPCDGCVGNGIDLDMDNIDDNCTCVPMGADVDGDGLDDNCDPCLLGPQHDEDGDGVMDACDNCPGIANLNQANTGDSIPDVAGDVCDPSMSASARTFDNFEVENHEWFQFGAGWSRHDGAYHLAPGNQSMRALGVGRGHFRVISGIKLGAAIGGPGAGEAGVYAGDVAVPLEFGARCVLSKDGTLTMDLFYPGVRITRDAATSIDGTRLFVISLDMYPKNNQAICSVDQVGGAPAQLAEQAMMTMPYSPGIVGNTTAEFQFYDLIDDQ